MVSGEEVDVEQPARKHMMGLLTSGRLKGLGMARQTKARQPDEFFPAGNRQWQEIFADRLERIISCYKTPEEQFHASCLRSETSRVVERVKDEVTMRGVDWHRIAPPRPVGVDNGGIVLAWDEPTWGAEIEIEISREGDSADVFYWADLKADSKEVDTEAPSGNEPLEELQDFYFQRLIQLLCGEPVS